MATGTKSEDQEGHSCPSQNDQYPSDRQIRELRERIEGLKRWSSFLDGVVAGCFVAAVFSAVGILIVMKGCR
jgi:hypothetical protein